MTAEATTTSIVRTRVASSVDAGRGLEEIEAKILAPAPVSEETRAALWLYAWLLHERRECHRARRQDSHAWAPARPRRGTRPARFAVITGHREPGRLSADGR